MAAPAEGRSVLAELRELLAKAAPASELQILRYNYGGGRIYTYGDTTAYRRLVADIYYEGDRELDWALRNHAEALVEVTEAAEEWRVARDRTNACRDEFGWDEEGYAACAQYQEAEDTAAEKIIEALAGLHGGVGDEGATYEPREERNAEHVS